MVTGVSICLVEVILTLMMTAAQDVETSLTTNSSSQDWFHADDQIPSKYLTLGFKPFSVNKLCI